MGSGEDVGKEPVLPSHHEEPYAALSMVVREFPPAVLPNDRATAPPDSAVPYLGRMASLSMPTERLEPVSTVPAA